MDMKTLMEMKGSKKMDPMAKKAKLGVLGELKKYATDMMANDVKGLKGMKKVTVAAPDDQSLAEGMDKAKEMLHGDEDGGPAEEAMESPDEEKTETSDEMKSMTNELDTPEEIDEMIKLLEAKKAKMGMTSKF